jgi:hypothetical protein
MVIYLFALKKSWGQVAIDLTLERTLSLTASQEHSIKVHLSFQHSIVGQSTWFSMTTYGMVQIYTHFPKIQYLNSNFLFLDVSITQSTNYWVLGSRQA